MFSMANVLSAPDRASVVAALVEGNSLRSVSRMTGVARNTVAKLLVDLGEACVRYHDKNVRGLRCDRIQADEVWSFVGAKQKNVPYEKAGEYGDVWTWVCLDADTKLCVSYLVGPRIQAAAYEFMRDVASRVVGRTQLTTDGLGVYPSAVERAFGSRVDYAQLVKLYGQSDEGEKRYSPAVCIGCERQEIQGAPDPDHISTSYVERSNLTMRMSMRRFTRLTNAFSKKVENHWSAVALHFMHYNFCRIHGSLRITPAMAAGIARKPWSIAELVGLFNPVS